MEGGWLWCNQLLGRTDWAGAGWAGWAGCQRNSASDGWSSLFLGGGEGRRCGVTLATRPTSPTRPRFPASCGLVGLVGLVGEVTREPGKYFSFFLAFPKKPGCTRRLVEPAQRGLVGLVGLVGEVTREPGRSLL